MVKRSYTSMVRQLKASAQAPAGERRNCLVCEHFRVTWNPSRPRACAAFGFSGKQLPSVTVRKTTGVPCPAFSPRPNRRTSKK